ncbi:thaumatin [Phlyctochytrium arcticum]|nr:thaumatin [Phlyctochytrium arcticum]
MPPVPTGQKAPVPNSTKAPTAPPPKGTMAPGSGSGSTPATDPGQTGPPVPKPSSGRLIEIVNRCPYTVWPGLAVGAGGELPEKGGFELTSGSTKKLEIKSDTWVSGRIWPRTGCRKDGDKFICATGDCGNKFQCDGQSGKTPATLAEFTLQKGQPDFYDVSNVDGHSIGISIETYGDKVPNPDLAPQYNCGSTACTLDMKGCPPELQLDNGSGGVACANIGTAIRNDTIRAKYPKFQQIFADKDALAAVECACDCPDGSSCGCGDATCKYGCTPHGAKPDAKGVCRVEKWPKSESPGAGTQFPAQYNEVFKKQCPDSYSWQFDDLSSTFQCNNGAYRVVFCPQGH